MADKDTLIAEAEAEAAKLPSYKQGAGRIGDTMDQHGLAMSETPPQSSGDYEDPSIVKILKHAYDGRTIVVPAFTVPFIMIQMLDENDSSVPEEFRGKRAWYGEDYESPYIPGNIKCLLHADQTDDIKTVLNNVGLSAGRCRKSNIRSGYDLNEHMRLKHKREWGAIEDANKRSEEATRTAEVTAQTEAILELARAFSANLKEK
jgi:hypothetical protein